MDGLLDFIVIQLNTCRSECIRQVKNYLLYFSILISAFLLIISMKGLQIEQLMRIFTLLTELLMKGKGACKNAFCPHKTVWEQTGLQAEEAGDCVWHGRVPLRAHLHQQRMAGVQKGYGREVRADWIRSCFYWSSFNIQGKTHPCQSGLVFSSICFHFVFSLRSVDTLVDVITHFLL